MNVFHDVANEKGAKVNVGVGVQQHPLLTSGD